MVQKNKVKKIFVSLICLLFLNASYILYAQNGSTQDTEVDLKYDVKDMSGSFINQYLRIGQLLVAAALAIYLIAVIRSVRAGGEGRESIVKWLTALIAWCIFSEVLIRIIA